MLNTAQSRRAAAIVETARQNRQDLPALRRCLDDLARIFYGSEAEPQDGRPAFEALDLNRPMHATWRALARHQAFMHLSRSGVLEAAL